jgi:SPASM domain peptide maturase of grasp-with-spasm system
MNKTNNNYLVLFAHCIPVKGVKYSIIQDNLRQVITRIPNEVFEFLKKFDRTRISAINKSNFDGTDEIIDFLWEKEFIFFTDNAKNFLAISEKYETTERINNTIIEYSSKVNKHNQKISCELSTLRCKHLELRSYQPIKFDILNEFLTSYINTSLVSIDVLLAYSEEDSLIDKIKNLIIHNLSLINIFVLHSVPEEVINKLKDEGFQFDKLFVTNEALTSNLHCGVITEKYFSMHLQSYLLSKNYNNCLYKKISIDKEGQIKLCPSQKQSYGSIENTSLIEVAEKLTLNPLTTINKDAITTCKSCEYRYACSDCRAFLENPDDIYSKPLKCGYDPATGIWEAWSTNPLKQKAIEYYGLASVV